MTATRTASETPLPDDDEDIKVGDDAKQTKRRAAVTPNSRKQLGRPERRRGRKPGPTRVMMNVRVLLETDDLVTEIGEETGMGPQDVTDVAIARSVLTLLHERPRGTVHAAARCFLTLCQWRALRFRTARRVLPGPARSSSSQIGFHRASRSHMRRLGVKVGHSQAVLSYRETADSPEGTEGLRGLPPHPPKSGLTSPPSPGGPPCLPTVTPSWPPSSDPPSPAGWSPRIPR